MGVSKKQWRNWSLPSKLTAIGAVLSAVSLGLYIIEKTFNATSETEDPKSVNSVNASTGISNSGDMKIEGNVTIKKNDGESQ